MLNGSAIMLIAMMLVNVFNFGYNMVMARMLVCRIRQHQCSGHPASARILHQSGVPVGLREVCGQKSFRFEQGRGRSQPCLAKPGSSVLRLDLHFFSPRNRSLHT